MKAFSRTIMAAILAASVSFAACGDSLAVVDRQATTTASATRPWTYGPLLDDFSYGQNLNSWGGRSVVISSAGVPMPVDAKCDAAYTNNTSIAYGSSGYSLKLDYNVSRSNSYAGYVSDLGGANLSTYKYVSFWIRGAVGGEFLKVQISNNLADANRNHASVYITDYLDGGVTTAWKKVTIPLDAFANISDWTNMKEIAIVFENYQSVSNGSATSGIVYIDNVNFGTQFLGFVRVNRFGHKGASNTLAMNALSGQSNFTSWDGLSASASTNSTYYNSSPYSARFGWTNMALSNNRWAAVYFIVGGGNDGWYAVPHNFSNYSQMSFMIKGEAGNEFGIRAELESPGLFYRFKKGIIPNANWQNIVIHLSEFKNGDVDGEPSGTSVDPSLIQKVAFSYSYWMVIWGGKSTGAVYLDDIQFQISGYTPDTTAPTAAGTPSVGSLTGTTVTVMSTASSASADPSMESVTFVYLDGSTWKTIGTDYDTTDGTYSVSWNLSGLTRGTTYQVRAVAMDAAGYTASSGQYGYTRPNFVPTCDDFKPSSGASRREQFVYFTTVTSDADGPTDTIRIYMVVRSSWGNTYCLAAYYNSYTNKLFFANNVGAYFGNYAPGTTGSGGADLILENSYAQLNVSKTSVIISGNTVRVNWCVAFKPSYLGTKNRYTQAIDGYGGSSPVVQFGTWTIQ